MSQEQLNVYLKNLDIALMNDIENIKNFDKSDVLRLEKAMLLNLHILKKYDAKTLKISRKLDSMYSYRDFLIELSHINDEEVIEYMIPKIKLKMVNNAVVSLLLSSDFSDFIKKFSILLALDYFAFRFSLMCMTSEKRKKMASGRLVKLTESIVDTEFNYILYKKINSCFAKKLDVQYDKLVELYPEINKQEEKIRRKK